MKLLWSKCLVILAAMAVTSSDGRLAVAEELEIVTIMQKFTAKLQEACEVDEDGPFEFEFGIDDAAGDDASGGIGQDAPRGSVPEGYRATMKSVKVKVAHCNK